MSFFDSDIVQEEMKEIQALQNKVYSNVWTFANMNDKDKLEHIDALERLLHKQQILYKRVSLSDDPKAKEMKDNIMDSAEMFGFPKNGDLSLMFGQMNKAICEMKKQLDRS
jgi:hypothetical protein|tara:strand:+ start:638 stop:970 length:333 start_codon:yes stop_codon:yes gene_type:complete